MSPVFAEEMKMAPEGRRRVSKPLMVNSTYLEREFCDWQSSVFQDVGLALADDVFRIIEIPVGQA